MTLKTKNKSDFYYNYYDCIVARATPSGSGAIAVIRVSGLNSISLVAQISRLPKNKNLVNVDSHTINFGYIIDNIDNLGNIIDQVMISVMKAPKTFTGENIVEISCHNNPFIIETIINLIIGNGARLAYPGEFTKRAFLNGKIDLIKAESINDLINANTQLSLRKSLSQLEGSFSSYITKIEKDLLKTLAFSESSFEFIDEDLEFCDQIKEIIELNLKNISLIKKCFNNQEQIRQGVRIAILGSTNAGKSSLFNSLLNKERSIVTDIAGTTRDTIEASMYKNGQYLNFIDTAGLRQTNDIVEQYGIERSNQEAEKADIIILVYDGSKNIENISSHEAKVYEFLQNKFDKKIIQVVSKSDLNKNNIYNLKNNSIINISTKTKENINILEQKISDKIKKLFENLDSPFLLNKRQFNLIISLELKLSEINQMLYKKPVSYEILSYELRLALESITELTGKTISEAGMDAIFKEFCIGK